MFETLKYGFGFKNAEEIRIIGVIIKFGEWILSKFENLFLSDLGEY